MVELSYLFNIEYPNTLVYGHYAHHHGSIPLWVQIMGWQARFQKLKVQSYTLLIQLLFR